MTESAPRPRATQENGIMAAPIVQLAEIASEYGSDVDVQSPTVLSDYGSDIGLEDLNEDDKVIDDLDTKRAVLPSIEFEEGEREDEEQYVEGVVQVYGPAGLRVARASQKTPAREREALEVEYDEGSRRAWSGTFSSP